MARKKKIIIRDGHVIDPANGIISQRKDILIHGANIVTHFDDDEDDGDGGDDGEKVDVFDAGGAYVCPGLVDMHAHVMEHATPLGVNADEHCLKAGVTTVVDAGSVGATTFPALKHFVIEKSKTRVFALLHVACHGLAGAGCSGPEFDAGGESDHLNALKTDLCVKIAAANSGEIVGIKVRLDKSITDGGRIEAQVFSRACDAAFRANLPLMVHHSFSGIDVKMRSDLRSPNEETVGLKPGDIYTHCFSAFAGKDAESLVDKNSAVVRPWPWQLRQKGIWFDVGHGQGSFSWQVASTAISCGFLPDVISTDLHCGSVYGAAKSLVYVMSKFLALGMSLEKVVESVTTRPAQCLKLEHIVGSLAVGREADVVVLRLDDVDEDVEDSMGEKKKLDRMLRTVAVWRKGERIL